VSATVTPDVPSGGPTIERSTVTEETARRIAEALERLAAAAEAQAEEAVSFPLGPILPKDRPRAGGRRR
jgi:hypothetical protein